MNVPGPASEWHLQLSDRIRIARRHAGLTQTALARAVGVTPSAAAQWEHPRGTRPGLSHLERIASTTRVEFRWLATGRGDTRRAWVSPDGDIAVMRLQPYAEDRSEEILLEAFRRISPRGRQMLSGLMEEILAIEAGKARY